MTRTSNGKAYDSITVGSAILGGISTPHPQIAQCAWLDDSARAFAEIVDAFTEPYVRSQVVS